MPERETVSVLIDDEAIRILDVWQIMDPIWWTAEFWAGAEGFAKSVERFSDDQRWMLAICVYVDEVTLGGHELYLSSAFGNLWRGALLAFENLGLPEGRRVLEVALRRLGQTPSNNESERESQIKKKTIKFHDDDAAFSRLLKEHKVEATMIAYIRANPKRFHFSGNIRRILDRSSD